ncbi:MAG: hypothetical protein OXH78_08985 [Acidimicrobiaceae bacterium]|nr:hypothetical protein [Acidimicrobiaceae bacterium]
MTEPIAPKYTLRTLSLGILAASIGVTAINLLPDWATLSCLAIAGTWHFARRRLYGAKTQPTFHPERS